jgi:hypothetical protein
MGKDVVTLQESVSSPPPKKKQKKKKKENRHVVRKNLKANTFARFTNRDGT